MNEISMSCAKEGCNGGIGFEIRNVGFCSPQCGNTHFVLQPCDTDYWESECETEFDSDIDSKE